MREKFGRYGHKRLCKTMVSREISGPIKEFNLEINCDIAVETIAREEFLIITALLYDFVRG